MRIVVAALATLLPLQALAQGTPGDRVGLAFSFGGGLNSRPSYFGSDSVEAGPSLSFDVDALRLGPISFGGSNVVEEGFGFRGSLRYIPERTSDDDEELAGLEDIDAAFELGGGLSFARPWYEAFAVARYGIGGSNALVGELGMDFIARPSDRLSLRAGPRVFVGSDDFAATYFGVTEEEAAASVSAGTAFTTYDATGGVLSSGIELGAGYRLTDAWGVDASVNFQRLLGDAEDSPITIEDNQVSATVEVTRRFDFRF